MFSIRLAAGLAGAFLAMTMTHHPEDKAFDYPPAPKDATVDDYHGTKVPDPYRPLEDPDSPATRAWVEAENKITFGFLEKIPQRDAIKKRLTALWDYEKFGIPSKEGSIYSFSRNSGLQNQSVLYTTDKLDGEPKLLIDPNTLTKDGTVALSGARFSQDGKLFAYGLASAGSDWTEWKVRDVATRQGSRRPSEVDQVLLGLVDEGRHRASTTDDSPSPPRARTSRGRTTSRSSTTTSSARPRSRTCSSTSGPTRRSGSSTAR